MKFIFFYLLVMNKQKQAFTLVELIVVITILAILWTIAFISLQWYSKDARDGVRISDVSNMKTALELFHLDAGKYPLSDDGETVLYSWATVWTQWEFWDTVISSLSRSLDHAPTDPLSDKKYVYSVSWNKNQFEILNLIEWEWDIALWNITQTNAVTTTRIPKIDGIYNGLYVKTGNYIVATPSLITAYWYVNWADLSLAILSSMVVEWYTNVPDAWNATTQTWAISWIVLSATWIINKDSTDAEKISVMRTIQNAYTWSDLAGWNLYDFILSKTSDEDILALSNSIVLNISTSTVASSWAWWETTYAISSCPAVNSAQDASTPTREEILLSITDYIWCSISWQAWVVAWYSYSWAVLEANKMVLMAATADEWNFQWWANWTDIATLANVTDYNTLSSTIEAWDGYSNSQKILTAIWPAWTNETNRAAQICDAKWTWWYLPAAEEINQIYCYSDQASVLDTYYWAWASYADCVNKWHISANIWILLNYASNWHWASTESSSTNAWRSYFAHGYINVDPKTTTSFNTRCVNRF